jgi:anti-sigma factor RsiW
MKNPAREKFLPLLSPYVDGELTPEERQQVEQHLANSKESAGQVADFRAGDALIRHSLDLAADDIDWKDFTNQVMARVTPEKLGLFERLSLTFSELFTYKRGTMVAAFAGAAAALLVAVPVAMKLGAQAPEGYANAKVEVQSVTVDNDARVRPVVMETDNGDAVIWLVPEKKEQKKRDAGEGAEEKPGDL